MNKYDNYDEKFINKMEEYDTLVNDYRNTLCGLIDYTLELKIIPIKLKLKIPFIKNHINNIENETELLENGLILLENKYIINNFDINNMFEFSEYYNNIASQNDFLDIIDDFVNVIKKKKLLIKKEDIDGVKTLFEYIFDIIEKIKKMFE